MRDNPIKMLVGIFALIIVLMIVYAVIKGIVSFIIHTVLPLAVIIIAAYLIYKFISGRK